MSYDAFLAEHRYDSAVDRVTARGAAIDQYRYKQPMQTGIVSGILMLKVYGKINRRPVIWCYLKSDDKHLSFPVFHTPQKHQNTTYRIAISIPLASPVRAKFRRGHTGNVYCYSLEKFEPD